MRCGRWRRYTDLVLLLPVSHEDRTVRRMPWVSIAILAICVALQVHSCVTMPELEERGIAIEREMRDLRDEVVSERAAALAEEAQSEQSDKRPHARRRGRGMGDDFAPPPSIFGEPELDTAVELNEWHFRHQAQQEFDAGELGDDDDPRTVRREELQGELDALVLSAPVMRFGYRPALDGLASLLSSMFAHGGWLHLVGNMWFLYLVGCNLEDRWGRWQFTSFYLIAGIIAALTYTALHPESEIPLVGASGAVAGAMGAFMVCFSKTKVKIFYLYWLFLMPRWGTFNASAWLVLLFWVAEQALWMMVEVSGDGAGIAFSAHVGGFLFGAAVAAMLRFSGVDMQLDELGERVAADGLEVFSEDPLYLQAMEYRDRGEDVAAKERLVRLIADKPTHRGAREALFMIGVQLKDLEALDYSVGFLIDDYGRRQADEPLADLFRQLRGAMPDYGLTDQELFRVVGAAKRMDDAEPTIQAVSELMQLYPKSAVMPRAMWAAAEVQQRFGTPKQHRDTLERIVRRFPDHACGGMARRELEAMGARA